MLLILPYSEHLAFLLQEEFSGDKQEAQKPIHSFNKSFRPNSVPGTVPTPGHRASGDDFTGHVSRAIVRLPVTGHSGKTV